VQIDHAFLSHALNAVDAKGRVSVPSSFRSTVDLRVRTYGIAGDEVRATELMIGMHSAGDRLRAYDAVGTRQLMEEITEGVADLPARERREALTRAKRSEVSTLMPVSYDGAGRMVLPPWLRSEAGIGDTALFLGVDTYFEIWNPLTAREALSDDPMLVRMIDYYLGQRAA
jgi:MraZ protein